MSESKRKYFTFTEKELKWIDPLLYDWSKKEGKPYSDLIVRLLGEYKDREPPLRDVLDARASTMIESLSGYSARSKEALSDVMEKSMEGLQTVQSKLKSGSVSLMDQIRKVESSVRTKLEEIKAERE